MTYLGMETGDHRGAPANFTALMPYRQAYEPIKRGNSRVSYLIPNLSRLFRVVVTSESASYFILAVGQWIILASEESFNFVFTQIYLWQYNQTVSLEVE